MGLIGFCQSRLGSKPVSGIAIIAVVAGLSSGDRAQASLLVVGPNFTNINIIYTPDGPNPVNSGAGSIGPSSLDGNPLPYLYCVDIATNINVPGTFPTTDVTSDGKIRGTYVGGSAAVAGQVAWLLNTYGPTATTADQQGGLQAAIWKTEYGALFTLTASNSAATLAEYNNAITSLGSNSDPLNSVLWISPFNDPARTSPAQGLVTTAAVASVPEPTTVASALFGLLFSMLVWRRRLSLLTVSSQVQ